MHASTDLGSETPEQKPPPTKTRPGTDSEKRLCERPQHTPHHLARCVFSGQPILFNIEHSHSRSQLSDAITHRWKHLRTESINAIVTLSEAKHLWSISVRDRYKLPARFFAPLRNHIITDVLSHSYTVRHFRAEHPFINRMRLFADSWPGEFSCYQGASTCPHCCAIVVAHFK
jgi:hypothetical protein